MFDAMRRDFLRNGGIGLALTGFPAVSSRRCSPGKLRILPRRASSMCANMARRAMARP